MNADQLDKTGLIREAYRMTRLTPEECRSIFLDWVLKLPVSVDQRAAIGFMLETYGTGAEEHPMTRVLREGLSEPARTGRRGGRRGRVSGQGRS